jgi:deoxyribodipyrimidine photo-lyase
MSRDQRVADNWALVYSQELARVRRVPLAVVFTLAPGFLGATLRQYDFMIRGLEQVERALAGYHIPFFLLTGPPDTSMPSFVAGHTIGTLVTDFSPLRIHRRWKTAVRKHLSIPFYEVDAHNVVPCWIASEKREYAAATFRPKIQRLLPTFLVQIPEVTKHPVAWKQKRRTDWKRVREGLKADPAVPPVWWLQPGEEAAHRILRQFVDRKLETYGTRRNDPVKPAQSNLSPYLHFGQIAPQRVALALTGLRRHGAARAAYLEELIVRRELSDNFCEYSPSYDSVGSFPDWAKVSLDRHRGDTREYLYTRLQFERARTHDPLWNAAQTEMVVTGKMHGYLRMYWAKKILEWSATPEDALRTATYLNDKYQLDGRDPNGYTGIAWSIGGVHDRAWGERKVFGKVRYMSYEGCKRKFDVEAYITRNQGAPL